MRHTIPVLIELVGSLILICGYLSYRRGVAAVWANRALLVFALFGFAYGLMGVLLYWNHFGLDADMLGVFARTRPQIGGVAVGIFVALIISGEMWRIGRRRNKRHKESEPKHAR